ncbi:hypothetical protein [Arthrobacter sp. H5]|uniref:hypothetical protein n=1 Tax=Arthrobacter sp. H5 TaxID=1267973 RepID=UPI0006853056|nr:hypothetical protein [Arthrobacter sp. H5]
MNHNESGAGAAFAVRTTMGRPEHPSWLSPNGRFPEDLAILDQAGIEVLNSRIHRQLDFEYIHYGQPDPETQSRLDGLTEELNRRDREYREP